MSYLILYVVAVLLGAVGVCSIIRARDAASEFTGLQYFFVGIIVCALALVFFGLAIFSS